MDHSLTLNPEPSTLNLQIANPIQPQMQEAEEADAAVTERLISALAASLQDLQDADRDLLQPAA